MNKGVYMLLGTNLGDRVANLSAAKHHISRLVGSIVTQSSIYKTAAWGNTKQPNFYNQAIEMKTNLNPEQALAAVLQIETEMGRVREEKWGPRIIDIDILLWRNEIIKTDTLTIPHPALPQRRFTLIPLVEISPNLLHPVTQKSITTLLHECVDTLATEKLNLH